jgi:hypothetical protein
MTTNFFSPSLCCCFWIRDLRPGSGMGKNQDSGSGINIPDPQHCLIDHVLVLMVHLEDADVHNHLYRIALVQCVPLTSHDAA